MTHRQECVLKEAVSFLRSNNESVLVQQLIYEFGLKRMPFIDPSKDDVIPCIHPIGVTTCGYTEARHFRYDGSVMDHQFVK